MEEYEREVELIDYIEVLLKRKRLIMAVTLVCALGVGLSSLTQARSYESQALVVISQPITSTGMAVQMEDDTGKLGTQIQVAGMSATAYEALTTGDELIVALRDSLLASDIAPEVAEYLRDLEIEELSEKLLTAELVKATEDAESPLLSFRAQSSIQDLTVPMVNRWVELFQQRHRGLSSNVADDYYQWVEGQYEISKSNLERTEDELRELTTGYSELSVLETEIGIKSQRLGTSLAAYQELETDFAAKQRELDFTRQRIHLVELGDEWIGYAELSQLPTPGEVARSPRLRRELVSLLRKLGGVLADSLSMSERHEGMRRASAADRRSRLLSFERSTSIERSRRRAVDLDSTLTAFREEAVQLDQMIKEVGLDLEVQAKNLALEPPVLRTSKAIVDEALWSRALEGADLDERLQRELGKYRLVTETLNPTHEQLRDGIRTMQIQYDRATTRIGFLEQEIPVLEADLSGVQARLDSLVELESTLLHGLNRVQMTMSDSLAREALPLREKLSLIRTSLAAQRAEYLAMKQQEDGLNREVTRLGAQVDFQKDGFTGWSEQVRHQGTLADSLSRIRRRLERERGIYQKTFRRFSSLLEEARIAREQAAGDIQIVSRAAVSRPVPRGTVKKVTIAGIVGLMASVMLAFLLEYVARAREQATTAPAA